MPVALHGRLGAQPCARVFRLRVNVWQTGSRARLWVPEIASGIAAA